jgi:branched-chain amino acid transport system permease protein
MELLLQTLMNGIVVGSVYTLVSIGLALTFSIMRVINFAHGEFYMVGSFMTYMVMRYIVDNFWVASLIAVIIGAGLGFLVERIYRPTYGKGMLVQFIIALGLVVFLQEAVLAAFGGQPKAVRSAYPTVRRLGVISITDERLLVICVSLVLVVAIFIFLTRTRAGKAMRAAANNPLAARLVGISTHRMASFAFIGGISLAAIAGALLAPLYSINPFMGMRLTGVALVIIVIAGIGSIGGAAIIGYVIGIMENIFAAYVSIEWAFAVMFVLLLLVLLIKPMGLYGRERAGVSM